MRVPTESHKAWWASLTPDERSAKAAGLVLVAEAIAFPDQIYRGNLRKSFKRTRPFLRYLASCLAFQPFAYRKSVLEKALMYLDMDGHVLDQKIGVAVSTGFVERYEARTAPASLGEVDNRNVVLVATERMKASFRALDFFERRIKTDWHGLPIAEGELVTPYDMDEFAALEIQYQKLVALDV